MEWDHQYAHERLIKTNVYIQVVDTYGRTQLNKIWYTNVSALRANSLPIDSNTRLLLWMQNQHHMCVIGWYFDSSTTEKYTNAISVCIGLWSNRKVSVFLIQMQWRSVYGNKYTVLLAYVLINVICWNILWFDCMIFAFCSIYNSLNHEFLVFATNEHWNALYDGWFAAVFVIRRVGKFYRKIQNATKNRSIMEMIKTRELPFLPSDINRFFSRNFRSREWRMHLLLACAVSCLAWRYLYSRSHKLNELISFNEK